MSCSVELGPKSPPKPTTSDLLNPVYAFGIDTRPHSPLPVQPSRLNYPSANCRLRQHYFRSTHSLPATKLAALP